MQPGDVVVVRDERWTVARAESFERCTVLTLEGRGPDNLGRHFQAIAPFDHVDAALPVWPRPRKRRAVLRAALGAIARERPALGLWTAADASLDLLSYQLEPAMAVLRGATRVLLADGVGLGKTVQAGLILAELSARGLVDRALILCPAALREAWAAELRGRFSVVAAVLDHSALTVGLQQLPEGVNPWAAHRVVIASIDLVKRPDVLAAVEEVGFDLVIADEAHHLTPGSDRWHAVNRLATRSPWLVLVSATPHSGDQAAFDAMTAVGALGDPLVTFRRGRRDLDLPDNRREHLLGVVPTTDEARLLRAIDQYTRAIWLARGQSDRAVRLVASTLARRAASSATAVERTLTRRRDLLAGLTLPAPEQGHLPWDEQDEEDGDELDERLARPGLLDEGTERRLLGDLIELAHQASARSSKFHRLQRLLRCTGETAVVFTEYRDTLQAVAGQLAPAFRLGSIHGGVPAPLRQEVLRRFEHGDLDVLLATDTAGEGLNLHHRCRLVIDLELPWSPLRLEQRIGRVDRMGQRRRVHAVHLLHRDTVEAAVWSHLNGRRQRSQRAFNEPSNEEDMARALFDGIVFPSRAGSLVTSTRIDAAVDERMRVAGQRHARATIPSVGDRAVYARPCRARRGVPRAIALYERVQVGPLGGLIARTVVALAVDLGAVRTLADWRAVVIALRNGAVAGQAGDLPQHRLREPVLHRIAAARARLASTPRLHQAALFDRRAEQAAGTRMEVAARLDAALARRAASLGPGHSHSSQARLIAVWPQVSS